MADYADEIREEGEQIVQELQRTAETLARVVREQRSVIDLQEQMTQALRSLTAAADRIRDACDILNADLEARGFGTKAPHQHLQLEIDDVAVERAAQDTRPLTGN